MEAFDLLWAPRKPRRGPAPGLSLERIAAAGIALADAEGLAAASMRRVADALGVTPMALYRYLPGKRELMDVMVEAALGEPAPPLEGDGRAQLTAAAHAIRALHRRHPWLHEATLGRPPLGPNAVAAYDRLLAAARASACRRPRPSPPPTWSPPTPAPRSPARPRRSARPAGGRSARRSGTSTTRPSASRP